MSVFRIFRIARFLKLIKNAKGVRMIVHTFISTLPQLGNVGSLLFFVLFQYAVLGMNLFAYTKHGKGGGLDKNANFSSLFVSLFTLFRCSTGESWDLVLYDLTSTQ